MSESRAPPRVVRPPLPPSSVALTLRSRPSLEEMKWELDLIASQQQVSADEVVRLVDEGEDILRRLRHNLRQQAAAEITKIVIRSETRGDMKIHLDQLYPLTLCLKYALEARGVELDEAKFQVMVRKDNSIPHVLSGESHAVRCLFFVPFEDFLAWGFPTFKS